MILLLSTLCVALLIFSACYVEHVHTYTVQIIEPTCTTKGYTSYTCYCGDKRFVDYVDELGHDLIHHKGQNATETQIGYKAYDTCSRCNYTTYEEVAYSGISFTTIDIVDNYGYLRLPHATNTFSFSSEISVNGNARYIVSKDEYGFNTVASTTVPLNEGDNTIYIIETVNNETKNTYKIVLYRKPLYTITFTSNKELSIEPQYIEEGALATIPEVSEQLGYSVIFDYDFSQPVTENTNINVSFEIRPEMKDFQFTSTSTTCIITGINNTKKTELVIPNYVTSISEYAFYDNKSLTDITIGSNVSSIDNTAFVNCPSLSSICVDCNNQTYKSNFGILYYKDETVLVNYPAGKKDTSFSIPSGVKTIAENAFNGCTSLISVIIGKNVKEIGNYAFMNCYKLVEICNLSSLNVTVGSRNNGYIGYYAKVVHLSENFQSIVTNVDGFLFVTYSTEQSDYSDPEITAESYASARKEELVKIYKKAGLVQGSQSSYYLTEDEMKAAIAAWNPTDAYKRAVALEDDWATTDFNAQLLADYEFALKTFREELESDYNAAKESFDVTKDPYKEWADKLESDIFKFLLYEGKITPVYAKLEGTSRDDKNKITGFENEVAAMVSSENREKTKEEAINLIYNDNVESKFLNILTFWGTAGTLQTQFAAEAKIVIFQKQQYGTTAKDIIAYCEDNTNLILPNNRGDENYDIYQFAFAGCKSLITVTINDNVTAIDNYAFKDCTSLKNIIIGDNVTTIGKYAFEGCTALDRVYFKGSTEPIIDETTNPCLASAKHYYYSETKPTDEGNYWYYDKNGNVVEW